MKNILKGSVEISFPAEHKLEGIYDFPVEVDMSKVQVTEQEAVRLAAEKFNKEFCDEGLIAKPSEDAEQKVDRGNGTLTFGMELFNKSPFNDEGV